ncbi:DUF4199 domain-containing protein [Dyadobacter psychrotolerans]|uniref:DUF4199 domain-containing protein n=1 Tax=Dyadobacter psychrotolerans TaxID=2541721 RepID=A0A4R5DMF9_9BACT|nr:DUF4199 domain-containing protein [Dyadobacter psychrotolerans]TDE15462.1 DUF4199 domain-containing protein [Dyadobacter psychrotolerans]
MKRNVVVFGLISGVVLAVFSMIVTWQCYKNEDFESNMLLGYTFMLAAFSSIFVGIKSYRDKHNMGVISFGKAFKIGLLITLIASTFYVVAWLFEYYLIIPDFMDRYTAHTMKEFVAGGATPQEISLKESEMQGYVEMYKNPAYVVLFTYAEVLPIGLVISLISALILKRKSADRAGL